MLKIFLFVLWATVLLVLADPIPLPVADVKPDELHTGERLPDPVPVDDVPVAGTAPVVEVVDHASKTPRTAAVAAAAALGNITFTPSGQASCPPGHLFSPCECIVHGESARIIRCGGDYSIDLNPIFQRLSIYLPKPDKHFHMFYMNNTNLTYLGNVFHDITFEYIYFDGANQLEFIDPNTFDVTGPYVKEVRAFNTKLKQKSLEDSLLGLSSLLHLTVSNVAKCPPEEIIRPCRCEYRMDNWQWIQAKFTRFTCGEETIEDMKMQYVLNANRTREQFAYSSTRRLQIYFERLSENLNKLGWQKRFDEFVLQNSAISEIPRNAFNDIIFYSLRFDNCPELTSIHPHAFQMTEPFIEELYLRKTRLGNERWKLRDTFNAITSLTNLRALYLIESGLQSIPHHAFRPLKGRFQRKLVKIVINEPNSAGHAVRDLGSYAFYYLMNLKIVDLSLNSIDKIHKHAFSFRWESQETLNINLAGNNLSENSIETAAFTEMQRPVKLVLGEGIHGNPELKHLEERIFRPFLADHDKNEITLHSSKHPAGGNRVICDCQSRWMFNEFGKIRSGLKDVMCNPAGSWECLPSCLAFGNDLLHCGSTQFLNIEDAFYSLNRNLAPEEKHFKRFIVSNTQLESIPHKAFGDVTFERFELDDTPNLKYVDDRAFNVTKDKVTSVMIRNTPQLAEMRFSSFQYLEQLQIKFIGKFRLTDESFKSDLPTETLLKLHLDTDGLTSNSIETNALSYAYRPIHVFLDHPEPVLKSQCKMLSLEEEIYAPFLAVNPENRIRVNHCPVNCDCSIKWLFDAPKDWWMRVEAGEANIGLQCEDQRSLYFYSDYDFRSCPKSNLLKYFVPETASKIATATKTHEETKQAAEAVQQSKSEVVKATSDEVNTVDVVAKNTEEISDVEPQAEESKVSTVAESKKVPESKIEERKDEEVNTNVKVNNVPEEKIASGDVADVVKTIDPLPVPATSFVVAA